MTAIAGGGGGRRRREEQEELPAFVSASVAGNLQGIAIFAICLHSVSLFMGMSSKCTGQGRTGTASDAQQAVE